MTASVSNQRHVTKHTHDDGVKLPNELAWCGHKISQSEWHFIDTHHVALSVDGSVQPCRECIKSIVTELSKELED